MNIYQLVYRFRRMGWKITRPLTVGVRIMLVRDNSILLVRHTYQNRWYIPGGRVEKRETLEEAIRRELREEIGCKVGKLGLFGVYSNFYEYKSDHVIVFRSDQFDVGERKPMEIEAVSLFDLDDLPSDVSPGTLRRIEDLRADRTPYAGRW